VLISGNVFCWVLASFVKKVSTTGHKAISVPISITGLLVLKNLAGGLLIDIFQNTAGIKLTRLKC